jgi:hypothetical protein
MIKTCLVDGCDDHARRGGMCEGHYTRARRGLPLGPLNKKKLRVTIGSQHQWIIDHVDYAEDGCLIWPFSTQKDGRGQVAVGDKNRQAHRVMCELKNGAPPTPKHEAAHECGHGHLGCVHPEHLTWKTSKENKADQVTHDTRMWGEKHPAAILTEPEVLAIRYIADTTSRREIAAMFHLKPEHVGKIITRQSWRHI